MATIDVSVTSDLESMKAWAMASDLSRFDQWLTIFGGWKSDVPSDITLGTKVSALIKVKGFRNIIHWEVTEFELLRRIELTGTGRGGVRIRLNMTIANNRPGSTFHLIANFSGGLLNTKIGDMVAKILESDVRKSVENLASLL